MNQLNRDIEDLMSAITFAEAGEADTAMRMAGGAKSVLFASQYPHLGSKAFRYAMSICKRIGARLDIIYTYPVSQEGSAETDMQAELEVAGISFNIIRKSGCLKQEIIDYTNSKQSVVFAVTGSSSALDAGCSGRRLNEAWRNLRCPLVVVEDKI